MNFIEVLGLVAGVFTSTSLLPQLVKLLKDKKANDISLGMLFTLLTGLALWIVYGVYRNDLPIILTNSFSFVLNIATVVLSIKYKKRSAQLQ